MRAIRPDGTPITEGALAYVVQSGKFFPVGMDGKLYLQGIDRSSEIEIRLRGRHCPLDVPYPAGSQIITDVGDVVCELRETP